MKINIWKNVEDIAINLDKFPNENNILLITGLSGSGKSFLAKQLEKKYNASSFQVEWLIHAKHIIPEHKHILDNFLNANPQIVELVEHKWNNCKTEDKNTLLKEYMNKFFEYFLSVKDPNKIYIVEGLQLFTLIDFDKIDNFPIIIKGTSSVNSLKNRLKRDLSKPKNSKFSAKIKYFFKVLSQSRLYQFKHRKKLNEFLRKYN
ncbi:MAG: hypothetical protein ACI4R8_00020 [Candidatus Caccovivens sp.]